jgi:hypothetical protein
MKSSKGKFFLQSNKIKRFLQKPENPSYRPIGLLTLSSLGVQREGEGVQSLIILLLKAEK